MPCLNFLCIVLWRQTRMAIPCSDASTEDSQHQKCGFRNAPHRFLGLVFVNAVYDERDCIEGKKIVGEATMQSVHYSIQKTL